MAEARGSGAAPYARHRLAWFDQLAFELFRATGRSQLMQCLWLYERDVDHAALQRVALRLAGLAFNRLIEPSPLPLARPRWVRPASPAEALQVSPDILPRQQLLGWANQQARLPIHPVTGPAWRMAVQRFVDGSTAVSIVGSHVIVDGLGAIGAIAAAASGTPLPSGYLPRGGRGRVNAVMLDSLQVLADAPQTLSAIARIARVGRFRSVATEAGECRAPSALVDIPALAVSIGSHAWDRCAERLGGRASSLLPAFVARLAAHMGRCRASDGSVSLLVPIDRRRGLDDERALAIEFASMSLTPAGLATDLRPVKAAMTSLLRAAKENRPDPLGSLLPALSWLPASAATALVNQMFAYGDAPPVSCSNLGKLPDALSFIDVSPCTRLLARAVDVNVTLRDLQRSHGHLVVVASRYREEVSLCIEACQLEPEPTNTEYLRRITSRTLADFDLDAEIEH